MAEPAADAAATSGTPPSYSILSSIHKRWMVPVLECAGWVAGAPPNATFVWQLRKKKLPDPLGAAVHNSLPNLLMLDDKAVLGLLSRGFTRTAPLITHVLYGEWDDSRIEALRARWAEPGCSEPRWWIVKDAHSSNGFSAALFDRAKRPLAKEDVSGGYCYVLQEYVERPLTIEGRKFELRQYVLVLGDGAAYTYEVALLRLASVAYAIDSTDRRAHITNKWIQTGWEGSNELCTQAEMERLSLDWPTYDALLAAEIVPLVHDLADAVAPLLGAGYRASSAAAASAGFELFACDLVVSEEGRAHLMEVLGQSSRFGEVRRGLTRGLGEVDLVARQGSLSPLAGGASRQVNINPAFGTFSDDTEERLVRPMFADLLALAVLPFAPGGGGAPAAPTGRFRRVRCAGLELPGPGPPPPGAEGVESAEGASAPAPALIAEAAPPAGPAASARADAISDDLRSHMAYVAFKQSSKKRYERKVIEERPLLL